MAVLQTHQKIQHPFGRLRVAELEIGKPWHLALACDWAMILAEEPLTDHSDHY